MSPVTALESPWTPDRERWAELLGDQPGYRLDQLWQGLYRDRRPPAEISTLPKALKASIGERFEPSLTRRKRQETADRMTVKSLWSAADGASIETVLMHYRNRSTVCISSQAGCAMACGFCATGQAGYQRNLTVGEIIEQVISATVDAADFDGPEAGGRRLSNIVFMGMGEPLANYNRVLEAVRRIIGDVGIGARRITISTVGLVPQMLRLAEEGLQVGVALSLHAANDELRTSLVPLNRRHPIDELVEACVAIRERTGRRVSLEWAMIEGINDRPQDADELIGVATSARAHVNLIPLNPTPGWPTVGSDKQVIEAFAQRLQAGGVNATIRANRGTDIDAACGQLAAGQPVTLSTRPGRPTN